MKPNVVVNTDICTETTHSAVNSQIITSELNCYIMHPVAHGEWN